MTNKGYSLRQAAELSGVPTMTFHAWKKKGLITPDLTDDKGNFLFSEMMIERAKEIDAKRKAKKTTNNSGNLFENNPPVESVENGEVLPNDKKSCYREESIEEPSANGNDEASTADIAQNSEATLGQPDRDFDSDLTSASNDAKVIEVPSPVEIFETPTTIELAPASEIITLEDRANKIRQLQADVQRGIVEIGFELIAAKKEIEHGGWADWLATNFDWTQQTANRFMRVSERFGKLNNVVQFKPSTLQAMLSLPEGDEEAFIEAQSDKGKPIESQSAREVKAAVKDWNQQHNEETNNFSFSRDKTHDSGGGKIAAVVAPCVEEESISEDIPPDEELKKLPPIAYNRNSTTDWHTPFEYIEAARIVLGGIDLDPASSELANQTVKATEYFTTDDNGLNHEWHGRIWLNPPFASGLIERFVDKLLASSFEAAIILVDNATETRWFRKLADNSSAIVFTTGRINFFKGGTHEAGSPTRGQTFFYFGSAPDKFFAAFQQFGWCAKKIIPPIVEATLRGDSDDDR